MSNKIHPPVKVQEIPINNYAAIMLYPERLTCGIAVCGVEFITDRRLTIGPIEVERHKIVEIAEAFTRLAGEMHDRVPR
jgi:hypothetical protein